MSDLGCDIILEPANSNGTFGNRITAGSITLRNKSNKNVEISSSNDITSDYKIILPNAIGSVDNILKIASVNGSVATCEWGESSGGGDGIVNNRFANDLTIGEDDSNLLVVNSQSVFNNKVNINKDLVVSNTISAKHVNEDIMNKAYTLNNKINTHNNSWSQLGTDIDGEATGDESGHSVSLSADGTIVAIGAINNDGNGSNSGHVRIYQYSSGSWSQLGGDIDGEATDDRSGYSVSLSADGTIVAIGANNNDGTDSNSGHVRIYQYDATKTTNITNQSNVHFGPIGWRRLGADIDGEATGDESGHSVSLSADGTIVAIGAINNDGNASNSGHTRIYQYTSGSWNQLGGDIDGEATDDSSGVSVSLSADGTIVAIGAINNDGNGSNSGHTRIYQYTSGSWNQLGGDIDGEAADDLSGYSVSLSADGSIVAIGAHLNEGGFSSNGGHVRIYQYSSGSWSQLGTDIDGEATGDESGHSVSLSADGTIVAIGAINNDGNASNSGHVRIYQYSSGSWSQLGGDIDGEATGDESGHSVSLSADGTIVAIGAPNNDGNGSNSGHTRIYHLSEYFKSNVKIDNDLDIVGDINIQGKIKGDVVIGEDDSDILTIANKLHIPGGENRKVLSQATDGSIEYGPTLINYNMKYKTIDETGIISVPASAGTTASNGAGVPHLLMNITITPQLTISNVMITVNIIGEWGITSSSGGVIENKMAYLKRTINGGTPTDLAPPVDGNSNRGLGQFVISYTTNRKSTLEICNFHYIDTPNTTHSIEYQVMLVTRETDNFHYNKTTDATNDPLYERGLSFISAEEKIADDNTEQALAGGGGTATFTAHVTDSNHTEDNPNSIHNNSLSDRYVFSQPKDNVFVGYEFNTPQFVNQYRIWGYPNGDPINAAPTIFEFRAAVDKATYDSGTYVVLDEKTTITADEDEPTFTNSGNASDQLSGSTRRAFTNTTAYEYYVLHIINNRGNGGVTTLYQLALYGDIS